MRKIIVSMMVTADGFVEGKGNDINWHVWDEEMETYMLEFMETVDTFIYGRKSYELMLEYWPEATGRFADIMNSTPKIVFSKSLTSVAWNATLVSEDVWQKVSEMKARPGKDLVLFAGADILSTFINLDLVDEYRLIVNPVAIGSGTRYFMDPEQHIGLRLIGSQVFNCGNVLLRYEPNKN